MAAARVSVAQQILHYVRVFNSVCKALLLNRHDLLRVLLTFGDQMPHFKFIKLYGVRCGRELPQRRTLGWKQNCALGGVKTALYFAFDNDLDFFHLVVGLRCVVYLFWCVPCRLVEKLEIFRAHFQVEAHKCWSFVCGGWTYHRQSGEDGVVCKELFVAR